MEFSCAVTEKICFLFILCVFSLSISAAPFVLIKGVSMVSGAPKGENCQIDMDSKAGDLFSAEDAHPTGTGGAGIMAK